MLKILLIDDDSNIIEGLETILRDHFPHTYQIFKAFDGRQALELLTQSYYHIIISDIKMPQLDGIRLLELIHREELPSTVIMLSGYDDYMYIRTTLRLGAYDYLLKPVNIQGLVDLLSGLRPEDSTRHLPEDILSQLPEPASSDRYFDLECRGDSLTLPELDQALEQLQLAVLELDTSGVLDRIHTIFYHISEEAISREQLKKALSGFIYALMQKNGSLIKIVAQYKLSEHDLAAQIKNLPHLSQLMEKFGQILLLYIGQLETLKKNNEEYVIKKAQAYINAHLSQQPALADIAAQFRLHPNYFSSLFKKHLNITVREYILQQRVETAKEMMKDSSLRLLDIALAVGYEDAAHFNRAFKNVTGLSPSQYRSKMER
ncbi:MAG: response regulator [Hungatella sp.]|nr:response regulator [Hungatella sp.]